MRSILTNNQYIYYYILKHRNDDILNTDICDEPYGANLGPYIYTYNTETEESRKGFLNFLNIYLKKCDLKTIQTISDLQTSPVHQLCFVIAMQYYFL